MAKTGKRDFLNKDFPKLDNDLVLRAARGEPVERVPVWVMGQAGRCMEEFKEVRRKHDYLDICQDPYLACEMTLQPVEKLKVDAAVIFTDIMVVPIALGMKVMLKDDEDSICLKQLTDKHCVEKLKNSDFLPRLSHVFDAITVTRHRLKGKVPLVGFTGAPWTLMTYIVEGEDSKTQKRAKRWLYQHPQSSHILLTVLTSVNVEYLVGQVRAGAQMLHIVECHADCLGPELFETFCRPFLTKLARDVKRRLHQENLNPVPMSVFIKGAQYAVEDLAKATYDVIGLDWTMDPQQCRRLVGDAPVTLQGNLDPCALYAPRDRLEAMVASMCQDFGSHRWIANLGDNVYPDTNPENLKVFVDAVRLHSQ